MIKPSSILPSFEEAKADLEAMPDLAMREMAIRYAQLYFLNRELRDYWKKEMQFWRLLFFVSIAICTFYQLPKR